MALLTSYRFRDIELNDGISYAVPSAGLTLDDRQVAEESWVYRREELPISAGITLKEGVIPLNINIIASNGADFQAKLDVLARIFDTTDPKFYRFERKLPHEQYYRYIEVASRQVVVNRTERKVTVTLNTPERAWQDDVVHNVSQVIFDSAVRHHIIDIPYDGLVPAEPVVSVVGLGAGSGDTFLPLYYREVEVYVAEAQSGVNNPIKIISNWNTTSLVNAGKMREDGLDITVFDAAGRTFKRLVTGPPNARTVWVLPDVWPFAGTPAFLNVTVRDYNASSTEIPISTGSHPGGFDGVPSSGIISIADEILSYTGKRAGSGASGFLTGVTRGLYGTTSINFSVTPQNERNWLGAKIKYQHTLRVGYGYATGYQASGIFPNDTTTWPMLDYAASDNKTWVQTTEFVDVSGRAQPRALSWVPMQWLSGRPGEDVRVNRNFSDAGDLIFNGYRNANSGVSYRERAVLTLPLGRYVSNANLQFHISGGASGDTTTASIYKTVRNFSERFSVNASGQVSTDEIYQWLSEFTSGYSTAGYVTGPMTVGQDQPGLTTATTHLFVYLSAVPFESRGTNFYMETVILEMDRAWRAWPTIRFLADVERGYGAGEYPIVMNWLNLAELDAEQFSIWPRVSTGQTVTYDCGSYTVTGEPLVNCSYGNTTWLRLLPGTNRIRVIGAGGTGKVRITFYWRNKR